MTPKRIAYILNIFPKISETFIAGELAELRKRGVELRILSLLPPRDEPQHDIIRRAGLDQLVEYDAGKFADVVSKFRPELIHAHFAKEATEKARALSALTGIPFTFTAHGYDIHRKPPPDFQKRALAASAVVTVSAANRDYIEKTFGVKREHIHVIPCGVDTERFCPTSARSRRGDEAEMSESANPPPHVGGYIVCVARQVAVKNLGLLLDACALLRDRGVTFRCAMIGDGPLNAQLKARRTALKLDEFVEMPGAADQDEVLRWWQRASIGVLTSENEGMPVCLMEAAACGVPVVATRVGGIPELVEDGVTGLLTPAGDAAAFASALEKLLGDSTLRARMGAAARARAMKRFSVVQQVDALMDLWSEVLSGKRKPLTPALSPSEGERGKRTDVAAKPDAALATDGAHGVTRPIDVRVSDPFGAAADKDLPTIVAALDFEMARHEFKRRLPKLSGDGKLKLKAIRVTRHKPGRRAVVEYDVVVRSPDAAEENVTLIGKLRARRSGNEGFRQLEQFWNAGFQAGSADGISVPEPVGVIADFKMWFQRKVAGVTAEELFAKAGVGESVALARHVAEAIHKVHCCGVPTERQHTMEDELRILRECFAKVAVAKPAWTGRIAKLQLACEQLGASVGVVKTCGIHRDFYSAQVIVERGLQPVSTYESAEAKGGRSGVNAAHLSRLWLIDFDLYCQGDPGLDAGNFIGHITEQALRERGDAGALVEVERELEDRFVELSGEAVRQSVRAYTTLTLARHVFLSTRFPERAHLTERLMELCEQRVNVLR